MLRGKTESGFEFEIDEKVLDNMELLDAIAEADDNPLLMSSVVKMLLGDKQRKALYAHLRKDDGRVPVEDVGKAIADIFNSCGQEGKNC